MASQKITWTALPNGLKDGKLRLSVFVSPRLDPDANERLFGDWIDWPARLANVSFNVVFSNTQGGNPVSLLATRVSAPADSSVWAATFPARTTFVRDVPPPPYQDFAVASLPARRAFDTIKQQYLEVATVSPFERPIFQLNPATFQLQRPVTLPPLPSVNDFLNEVKDIKAVQRATGNFSAVKQRVATQINLGANAAFSFQPPPLVQERQELTQSYSRVVDLETRLQQNKAIVDADLTAMDVTENEFVYYQASRFYNRRKFTYSQTQPPPEPPTLDFHEQLGALGDYPALLRQLGIVIDLEVDYANNIPGGGLVAIDPGWPTPSESVEPYTRYTLDPNTVVDADDVRRFVPTPKNTSHGTQCNDVIRDGLLCLDDECYDLIQLDLDGGTSKLVQEAGEVEQQFRLMAAVLPNRGRYLGLAQEEEQEVADQYVAALPALRSGGFGIAKKQRAARMRDRIAFVAQQWQYFVANQYQSIEAFYADDLVRGYRVDVWDEEQSEWYSLCKRRGRYHWVGEPVADQIIEDEGYVKVSAIDVVDEEEEGQRTQEVFVPETLFQWDGWSLVAERPGKTLMPDDEPGRAVATPTNLRQSPLDTDFIPQPGTLPRLRFGKYYRLRSRTVDLAGNSISPDWDDMSCASESECYARYEPVAAPTLVLRRRLTEGESVERLVIRSNYDQTAEEYVTDPATQSAISGYDHNYTTFCDRHVAPPKTTQLIAETHGAFDANIGNSQTPAAVQSGFNIARKEEGTFYDTQIWNPTSAQLEPVADIELVTPAGVPDDDRKVTDLSALQRGESLGPGQYILHRGETLRIPYIPDVIARGSAFQGLPGSGDQVLKQTFANTFPDATPFRLRIVEVNGQTQPTVEVVPAPEFQSSGAHGQNVLVVRLPKAAVVKVKLSCYVDQQDLENMGLWCWLTPAQQQSLVQESADGRHWMITPDRELTLVHAVQQPLEVSHFTQLVGAKKRIGDTVAWMSGTLYSNVPSTDQVDVFARWQEPRDDPSRDLPEDGRDGHDPMLPYVSRVFDMKMYDTYPNALPIPVPANVATKDGRHRAADSFRHDFGDTKYREVEYYVDATTRFRDYFPPEIYRDRERIVRKPEEESHYRSVKILNSARPAAPKVLYVVPTFGWENKELPEGPVSRRCGGGLRVYLDRPWYSSGDGELLGVVVRPPQYGGFQFKDNFRVTPFDASDFQISKKVTTERDLSKDLIQKARTQVSHEAAHVLQQGAARTQGQATPARQAARAAAPAVANSRTNLFTLFGAGFASSHPSDLYTTQWGMDPIWLSVPPTGDVVSTMFPNAVAVRHQLSLAEASGMLVSCAGHQVHFDPDRKLWYCDIVVNTGDAYFPFIRLALTRFQPQSMPNAHLSRVVLSDFIQPVPDRVAAVTFAGEETKIMVSGVYGLNKTTPRPAINRFAVASTPQTRVKTSRRMVVTVEKKPVLAAGDWEPVSEEMVDVEMEPLQEMQNRMIWMKSFQIPEGIVQSRFRAVVREYEFVTQPGDRGNPERIVYADAIEFAKPK